MFDVYLNGRRDLLVVPRGFAIPAGLDGNWKRKKRAVRSVSDVIHQDVQQRGYHRRSLTSNRSETAVEPSSHGQPARLPPLTHSSKHYGQKA